MKTKCKHVKILMTRKTNKVANELNKLGIGKKTKYNRRREGGGNKGNTPHKRQISRCKRDGRGGGGRRWGDGGGGGGGGREGRLEGKVAVEIIKIKKRK